MILSNIQHNLANISFYVLLTSLISYWINLIVSFNKIIKLTGVICTYIGNLLIIVILGSKWIYGGYFPLSNLYESLLFLTWCLTSTHILLEKQINTELVGALIAPITVFTIAFATMLLPGDMQETSFLVPALNSNWLMMHVTVMMLSYACLITGSLVSMLFLCIKILSSYTNTNNIKNLNSYKSTTGQHKGLRLIRTNLLDSLDHFSYRIIGLGFPLLTVGIISGAVWANDAWGSYWSWDPKETWALITWIVFASYLHARLNKEWEGEKPALLASTGFFIIWICYLGVNFLGQGLHSYGWITSF